MSELLPHPLLWLDLETTGTRDDAQIIEIACCVTAPEAPFGRLDTGHFHALVKPADPWSAPGEVVRMHAVNGLWSDLATQPVAPIAEVEKRLAAWLGLIVQGGQVTPAGSGVGHYDVPLLRRWMPKVARRFTYYSLDVGVVRRWSDAVGEPLPERPPSTHRAWDDVLAAVGFAAEMAERRRARRVCTSCLAVIEYHEPTVLNAQGTRWSHYPTCPSSSSADQSSGITMP